LATPGQHICRQESDNARINEDTHPELIGPDRRAEASFEPLVEVIAEEFSSRRPGPELEAANDARGVAESIADAILDRFVVRPRSVASVDRRAAPIDAGAGGVILDVSDLTVTYGATKAVDRVSLQIMRGEIFGLLGPNGAGKTSTLSAIEGLIKPQSGAVMLDGIDIRRHPSQAKAKLGVQLQATSFQSQLTIRQIVSLYAGLYGVRLSADEIAQGLREIGLESDASKPFKQLSGGQQQRLSLYVAVLHGPALLLLDEPTSGLDPQSRRQLWGRIETLRQRGGSILLTTHSMEEAESVCDRVAIIDHGALLTAETPQNLIEKHKDDPAVRKVARGEVTLEDVFIGLTGSEIRE
jgi:ABC-2 type transport system ATP-binding protein